MHSWAISFGYGHLEQGQETQAKEGPWSKNLESLVYREKRGQHALKEEAERQVTPLAWLVFFVHKYFWLDGVALFIDSTVAILDKLGMTEALKSADSSHFGDRADLSEGLQRLDGISAIRTRWRSALTLSHPCSRAEFARSPSAATFIARF